MELKFNKNFGTTAGTVAFNRTAYGIEIVNISRHMFSNFFLLIAPLMELKWRYDSDIISI